MAAIVVRNLPEGVLASLKKSAKLNKRSTEEEVRAILKAAAEKADRRRVKFGSELAAIGEIIRGLEFKTERDLTPGEPADFS
jgi:plasmid stability protein